jgi:hypothetical protein
MGRGLYFVVRPFHHPGKALPQGEDVQFDHRKIMGSDSERSKLNASLDEYLLLEGDAMSRLRFKRKGHAREAMMAALAQMAMLFAAANMGNDEDFAACLDDTVGLAGLDDGQARALRGFYLRNLTRVPGTEDLAVGRLSLARPKIMDLPLVEASPAS